MRSVVLVEVLVSVSRVVAVLVVLVGVYLLLVPCIVAGQFARVVLSLPQSSESLTGQPMTTVGIGVPWGSLLAGTLLGVAVLWLGLRMWRQAARAEQASTTASEPSWGPPMSRAELVRAIEGWEDGHVALQLADGRTVEGWARFEDASDVVTFSHAPGPFDARLADDEAIALDDVDAWLDDARRWRAIDPRQDRAG